MRFVCNEKLLTAEIRKKKAIEKNCSRILYTIFGIVVLRCLPKNKNNRNDENKENRNMLADLAE